jgi:hypothetical protein
MTYSVYNDSGCHVPAVDAGTRSVVNGSVDPSNAISFENAGAAYWAVVYSGDAENPSLFSSCVRLTVTLPPPVAYQIQERKDVSIAGRKRTSIAAFIPGEPTKGQKIATLAAIARAELGSAAVVSILAWRSLADRANCVTYTVGGSELSTDRGGWDGRGTTTLYGPDNGQIQGNVELLPLDRYGCSSKHEQFSVPR